MYGNGMVTVMKNKNIKWLCLSLIVISASITVRSISGMAGVVLPELVVRLLGVAVICALFVFGYTAIRLIMKKDR